MRHLGLGLLFLLAAVPVGAVKDEPDYEAKLRAQLDAIVDVESDTHMVGAYWKFLLEREGLQVRLWHGDAMVLRGGYHLLGGLKPDAPRRLSPDEGPDVPLPRGPFVWVLSTETGLIRGIPGDLGECADSHLLIGLTDVIWIIDVPRQTATRVRRGPAGD